jgi:hypothetical protein
MELRGVDGLPENVSLQAAKAWLRLKVNDGAKCPCCTQYAKVYKRSITSAMACVLILIFKFFDRDDAPEWLHVPEHMGSVDMAPKLRAAVQGGDWAKMTYWQCLEAKSGVRKDGSNRVGFWKITPVGREFVTRSLLLPKYARVYDDRCLGLTGDPISIMDALKDKFDYDELMKR